MKSKKEDKLDLYINSWWNRTLSYVDLDYEVKDHRIVEYPECKMTKEAWKATVRKDLIKILEEMKGET